MSNSKNIRSISAGEANKGIGELDVEVPEMGTIHLAYNNKGFYKKAGLKALDTIQDNSEKMATRFDAAVALVVSVTKSWDYTGDDDEVKPITAEVFDEDFDLFQIQAIVGALSDHATPGN